MAVDKSSEEHLTKRLDAVSQLVEFLQKRLQKLEEESDQTRTILTQLQISIASLSDYFDRQKKLEEEISKLSTKLDVVTSSYELKFENLGKEVRHVNSNTQKIEAMLWALLLALVPGIICLMWEVSKHVLGMK